MLKKKMKKLAIIIMIIIGVCLISKCTYATTNEVEMTINSDQIVSKSNPEYVVTQYNIKVNVNEDNTYNIKERIKVRYDAPVQNFLRSVLLKTNIERPDGSILKTNAEISNVESNKSFSINGNDERVWIHMNRESKAALGYDNFNLNYTYNSGGDKLKEQDEFCYDLVNGQLNTDIANLTFEITMPKEFDSNNIKILTGKNGLILSENIQYTVNENVIKGSVNKSILSGEKISVRIDLPEGYFKNTRSDVDYFSLIVIALSVTLASIGLLIWNDYGRDKKIRSLRYEYPPFEYNSSEVAFFHDGRLEINAIIALLFDLANKGYLKIVRNFSDRGDYKIVKVKNYDGKDIYLKMFFEGLFKTKRNQNI